MSVAATSYPAKLSAAWVAMLAACASWTPGANQIIEQDAGTETPANAAGGTCDTTTTYATVRRGECRRVFQAMGAFTWEGDLEIQVHARMVPGDDPASAVRRCENLVGALVPELEAQLGTAGKPCRAEIVPQSPFIDDETASMAGFVSAILAIKWSDL
jgi:hypothetical protein